LATSSRNGFLSLFLAVVALAGCGGGGSTHGPSPLPQNPPTPPPPAGWSVSGQLVDTVTRQPLAGVQVAPTWDLAAVTTSADGSFTLSSTVNPPSNPYRLAISGAGIVGRDLWVNWQSGPRPGVTIEAIRDAAPFSMAFYRNFVRGTFDATGAPYAVLRWMESPRVYVKTVDQNGRPVEPEVLEVVRESIGRAVTLFTAGRLSVAALETGTDTRPPAPGWIMVDIRRDPNERQICGFASIGANPGSITLNNDVCSCGSNKIPGALVLHEVGHALGFFHVPDRNSVMYPFLPGNCPSGTLSLAEQYHAGIAYSRPRGNLDPDNDPSTTYSVVAPTLVTDR
jgi:Matrixin